MNIENRLIRDYDTEVGVHHFNVFKIPQELEDLAWIKNCEKISVMVIGEKGTAEYNENILIANYVMEKENLKRLVVNAIYLMINDHYIDVMTNFNGAVDFTFDSANGIDLQINFEKTTVGLFRKKTIKYFFVARFQRSNNRQINFQEVKYDIFADKS